MIYLYLYWNEIDNIDGIFVNLAVAVTRAILDQSIDGCTIVKIIIFPHPNLCNFPL